MTRRPSRAAVGRSIEDSPEIDASAGLAELERGDPLGQWQRGEIHLDSFGQPLAHRVEIQARRSEQLGGGTGGRKQAREQMLGPDFPIAV